MLLIQASKKAVSGVVAYGTVIDMTGEKMLTYTGAKISYRGGGWWRINGYSNTDSNNLVKTIKSRGVVSS